jgi:small neutral amino acid transporter SnatA (MarC family)
MDRTSITAAGAIDTFLPLLIGIGPKLALVPYLQITRSLEARDSRRVRRKMVVTAGTVALFLVVLGELLRVLLHFTIASLSIAGGLILLIQAVWMILAPGGNGGDPTGGDPMRLARYPLAVPYLLNPVGIVGLVTISAEATSIGVLLAAVAILLIVLLIDAAVFRWANQIGAKLDEGRMLVTEKVFGFLIAAIAAQLILDGLSAAGVIAPVAH